MTPDGYVDFAKVNFFSLFSWKLNTMQIKNIKNWDGEDIFYAIVLLGTLFACGVGMYALLKTATASGEVDSCLVGATVRSEPFADTTYYYVEGHRSWRENKILFYARTREEADAKMKEICPR